MALPCDPGTQIPVSDLVSEINKKVNRVGDTMTGPLNIETAVTIPLVLKGGSSMREVKFQIGDAIGSYAFISTPEDDVPDFGINNNREFEISLTDTAYDPKLVFRPNDNSAIWKIVNTANTFAEKSLIFAFDGKTKYVFRPDGTNVSLQGDDDNITVATKGYVREVISQEYTIGEIKLFSNKYDIPDGWNICDGTNGTPDMTSEFITTVNEMVQYIMYIG